MGQHGVLPPQKEHIMRRFKINDVPAPECEVSLPPEESRHLIQVLRKTVGETIIVFDGKGISAEALFIRVEPPQLAIVQIIRTLKADKPQYQAHMCMALAKQKAMDLAIRMAVEAGVTSLHLFLSERSIPKECKIERWQRIVDAAGKQCGRNTVPGIHWWPSLAALCAHIGPTVTHRLIAVPGAKTIAAPPGDLALIIGPEGGFATHELHTARIHDFKPVGLGRWTLRSDTAAAIGAAFVATHSWPTSELG